MSTTNRCYPPGGAATTSTFVDPVSGPPPSIVSYAALVNGSVDANYPDVPGLQALGWVCPDSLIGSGPTNARPPAPGNKGKFYCDTGVGAFIWSDGSIWRSFSGNTI